MEQFKTEINLVEYLQSEGYSIDKKKTSRNCIVLKNQLGEKLLVGLNQSDNHYFYTNLGDYTDKGSIIDFIQNRQNLNLGEVRKVLRPWIGSHPPYIPPTSAPKPTPSTSDLQTILLNVESFQIVSTHPYLTQRGISQQTTNNSRFKDSIYTDNRNNLIFLHQDYEGVCGYDIRNHDFKGFSKGGSKGLWFSQSSPDDLKLVVCESPIDCLSHYQLFDEPNTRYMATGGTLSQKQEDLLRGAFQKIHNQGGEIIIAADNDEAGIEMAKKLKNLAPETAQVKATIPKEHKDWNEALQSYLKETTQQQQKTRNSGWQLGR